MDIKTRLDRHQFLKQLGLSGAALLAVYCGGALSSCSNNTVVPTTSANFTIDLNSSITSVGSFVTQNGVVVARIASGNSASSFVAVSQTCPHEGQKQVTFQGSASAGFRCSAHGATFNTNGTCTNGVTSNSLQVFKVSVSGTTLTITS